MPVKGFHGNRAADGERISALSRAILKAMSIQVNPLRSGQRRAKVVQKYLIGVDAGLRDEIERVADERLWTPTATARYLMGIGIKHLSGEDPHPVRKPRLTH